MRIIAVANQKGGVAKTTTCINLGASLAYHARRVLIIDMDPQAHSTLGLGFEPNELDRTVLNVLEPPRSPYHLELKEVIIPTRTPNLYLAPANIDLAGAEYRLIDKLGREDFLNSSIQRSNISFDYILIDCPPSLGILTVNALKACREVIVTIQPHYFAMKGIEEFMETMDLMRENLRHDPEIYVLITIADVRTNLYREVVEEVKKYFGDHLFETVIHRNIALAEATSHGVPVIEYEPSSSGAQSYLNLAKEVIKLEEKKSGERLLRRN
ncbi:MAG TPA: ParA family protein [Candidatus Atribacteria bacterium]|nr:ParA family protein [Candidatus Atribacteria bacterium]HPZ81559.1 ParA family protein [Candidatus Atribacteria bacterium]HQE24423.1 ParA family protein [Candidatus Atribacteria bacterium]